MKHLLLSVIAAMFVAPMAFAAPYGTYDVKRIFVIRDTPSGKSYGLDGKYLDQMIGDLSDHAQDYPPKFDSPQDKQRAESDLKQLAGVLDAITSGSDPNQNPELLIRAALINSMGHNLDIKGSAERAEALFKRTLAIIPSNPHVNLHYGIFLVGTARARDGLPFLEKSYSGGYDKAAFSLGMAYLTLGDNEKALQYFEAYEKIVPNDPRTSRLIEAIRSGKVKLTRELVKHEDAESMARSQPKSGQEIYNQYCSGCHSTGIAGAPRVTYAKDWIERRKRPIDSLYQAPIDGRRACPPRLESGVPSDKEIQASVDHMLMLVKLNDRAYPKDEGTSRDKALSRSSPSR